MEYICNRHSKHLLMAHMIFVCKYRKKLLKGEIDEQVKQILFETCTLLNIHIIEMESDKDHIHMLIQYPPKLSITKIVKSLKSKTTYVLWNGKQTEILKHEFWKEHTFWSDGYFACSVGDASWETIRLYIENQG